MAKGGEMVVVGLLRPLVESSTSYYQHTPSEFHLHTRKYSRVREQKCMGVKVTLE